MDEQGDDIDSIIARSLSGELTGVEKEKLALWLETSPQRKAELEELRAIWEASSLLEIPKGETFENRWSTLSGATGVKKSGGFSIVYKIAASLLLVVVGAIFTFRWVQSNAVTIVAGHGEIKKADLPDGSTITLNGGSRVDFNSVLWFFGRTVSLEGEAFFNVRNNGSGFSVQTGTVEVTVLGTTFNVKNRNTVSVACFTGLVSINDDAGDQVQLEKGMKCTLEKEKFVVSSFDLTRERITSWMDGKLDFDRTPLQEVFQTIGQFYHITISGQPKSLQTFTGTFDKETTPESVISVVCLSTGLTYVREDSSRFKIIE